MAARMASSSLVCAMLSTPPSFLLPLHRRKTKHKQKTAENVWMRRQSRSGHHSPVFIVTDWPTARCRKKMMTGCQQFAQCSSQFSVLRSVRNGEYQPADQPVPCWSCWSCRYKHKPRQSSLVSPTWTGLEWSSLAQDYVGQSLTYYWNWNLSTKHLLNLWKRNHFQYLKLGSVKPRGERKTISITHVFYFPCKTLQNDSRCKYYKISTDLDKWTPGQGRARVEVLGSCFGWLNCWVIKSLAVNQIFPFMQM